jgi:hypothetical protein
MNPNTMILVSEGRGTTQKSATQHVNDTSQNTTHDSNRGNERGREVRSMNEDGPDDSPYGTLAKHNQSETKRDITSFSRTMPTLLTLRHRGCSHTESPNERVC